MKKLLGLALVALFALITTVSAAEFRLNVDTWLNDSSLYGGQSSVSLNGGFTWRTVYAGQFEANFVGDVAPGYSGSFKTYCTDLNNWLGSGFFAPIGLDTASLAPHNPVWTGNPLAAMGVYEAYGGLVSNGAQAAGLQLAIWNLLYDSDRTVSSGAFRATGGTVGAVEWANTFLQDQHIADCGTWWEPTWANGTYREAQGLLGPCQPVPEGGGTMASLAIGCLGVFGLRRKFC